MSESGDPPGFDFVDSGIALDREDAIDEAYMLIGELRSQTRWPKQTIERRVGCDPRTLRLPRDRAEENHALQHSLEYLGWLVELVNVVDLPADARRVVVCAYELSDGAGGAVADRVRRCRVAFERPVDGWLSARKLLELGEVAAAFETAALQLTDGPGHRDAQRVANLTAPLAHRRPHIQSERLQWLGEPDAALKLGANVAEAMRRHRARCSSCRSISAIQRAAA